MNKTFKNMFLGSLYLSVLSLLSCGGSDNGNEDIAPDPPVLPTEISITVEPLVLEVAATEGIYEVNVKTTGTEEWSASSTDEWIRISTKGNTNKEGTVKVAVTRNEKAERYGRIKISSGSKDEYVQVKQQEALRVAASEIACGSGAGSVEMLVYGSDTWEAQSDKEWASVSRKENKVQISCTENLALASRTANVTVTDGYQSCTFTVVQESGEDTNVTTPEGYTLVWQDEFNEGTTLSNSWTHEVQGPGWVNNELQTYVNGQTSTGKRVTELKNGKLHINCFKENGRIYSGRVYANVNTGWQYGYFEARILLPKGKGTWPAFWMMPVGNDWSTNPWPMCGEIDIMEEVGVVPNEVSSSIHTQDYNHTKNTQKTHAITINKAEGEFHVYALEWTEDAITTYVDGKVQLAVTKQQLGSGHNQWPFHYAFYPILNLAWGGSWGGMQGVDESALPVTMEIDYVRVFQKK